ncbi:MAG: acyl-CoA dehydrogenase family protein [Thermoanaerobaculia bacterium]
MRSVYFSEDHETFRRSVRDLVESEITPHAEEWEAAQRIPPEIWRRMGELGFLGIMIPEKWGGSGADVFFALAFLEELPRSRMGGFTAAVTVQQFIATGAILRHGTEEQKRRYLQPSAEGAAVGSISISEPDCGSDVANLRTGATRDGDSWVIDGAKTWITNGVYGDFNVVACRTGPEGAAGISLIVVDRDTPGVRSSKIRKIGWHSSDTAEITFDHARVPVANLLGRENMGFYYVMETFAIERIAAAATSVGSCDVILEETLRYMGERQAFGKSIDRFQALRHRIADLASELEAARQLVYHAAWLWSRGEQAIRESSMAKLVATELNRRIADECLQFFGGYGYTEEYPISRFFRDARVSTIVAGTSEIMREIIARVVIDRMAFPRIEDLEATAE